MTDRSFTPQNNLERKGTDQPGLTAESVTGKLIHRGRTPSFTLRLPLRTKSLEQPVMTLRHQTSLRHSQHAVFSSCITVIRKSMDALSRSHPLTLLPDHEYIFIEINASSSLHHVPSNEEEETLNSVQMQDRIVQKSAATLQIRNKIH